MLYVKVPKEIKEYEEKIIAGLSWRNIIWGLLAIVLGMIAFFLFKGILGESITSYIVMALVIPCFACGFLKVQDMSYDRYLMFIWKYYTKKQTLLYENKIEREEEQNVSKKKKRSKRKKYKENQEF